MPTRKKSQRASRATPMPMAAHSIHEGKNEPTMLICGPKDSPLPTRRRPGVGGFAGRERQGGRRLQQLHFRVELDEPGTAQLAAGREAGGGGRKSYPIPLGGILLPMLLSIDQRLRH